MVFNKKIKYFIKIRIYEIYIDIINVSGYHKSELNSFYDYDSQRRFI